jgi:hypothetical protein
LFADILEGSSRRLFFCSGCSQDEVSQYDGEEWEDTHVERDMLSLVGEKSE